MTLPVRGLRPSRAARLATTNVPKPLMVTRRPFRSDSKIPATKALRAFSPDVFELPAVLAKIATRSALVTSSLYLPTPRAVNADAPDEEVSWHPLYGLRILVIEDVPDIREIFEILLRVEGANVVSTGNGREAARIVEAREFDVVLSDLGLPDIPGDVLIRQIRATPGHHARVIVVTGYGEPFLTRARQADADVVFTKPVEWSRILVACPLSLV